MFADGMFESALFVGAEPPCIALWLIGAFGAEARILGCRARWRGVLARWACSVPFLSCLWGRHQNLACGGSYVFADGWPTFEMVDGSPADLAAFADRAM